MQRFANFRLIACLALLHWLAAASQDDNGKCMIWGDPHLNYFPEQNQYGSSQSTYWCKTPGRVLLVRNSWVTAYIHVAGDPYYVDNYEISFFSNGTNFCTVTPDQNNCFQTAVRTSTPRGASNPVQLTYEPDADTFIDFTITKGWFRNTRAFDLDVVHSSSLIRNSSGLCKALISGCEIELGAGRRRRSVDEPKAYQACNLFLNEATTIAQQAGVASTRLVPNAREACVTDILQTNDTMVGRTAAWVVLTDSFGRGRMSDAQREERLTRMSAALDDITTRVKPHADSILNISTTTNNPTPPTSSQMTTSRVPLWGRPNTASKSKVSGWQLALVLLAAVSFLV